MMSWQRNPKRRHCSQGTEKLGAFSEMFGLYGLIMAGEDFVRTHEQGSDQQCLKHEHIFCILFLFQVS